MTWKEDCKAVPNLELRDTREYGGLEGKLHAVSYSTHAWPAFPFGLEALVVMAKWEILASVRNQTLIVTSYRTDWAMWFWMVVVLMMVAKSESIRKEMRMENVGLLNFEYQLAED